MAKTLGIHLAGRRANLVALDGTFKKPKVRVCASAIAPPPGEDERAIDLLADELRSVAKLQRKELASDNIGLSVESSLATFRSLALPFAEAAKIEEVLKFEVEGQLPQWDIDSVVVDFHTIESTPVESQLLVTAVPKDELGERIDAAARAGLEPFDAEIEATALFRAAEQIGVLDPEQAQMLVHFGARTTTLVTVIEGRLTAMRAMHLELDAFDDAEPTRAAESEGGEAGEDGGEQPREVATEEVRAVVDSDRLQAVLARVQRELTRTMGSSQAEVDFSAVLICGIELAGLVGSDVGGVRIERLDPLEGMVELPADERARLAIAYGTALGRLGGSEIKPHLRREELTYASRFERLELPLGVLGLLTLTLLSALYIINGKVIDAREKDLQRWLLASRNFMIGELNNPRNVGALRPREEDYQPGGDELVRYVEQVATTGDDTRSYRAQIARVDSLIGQKIANLEEELGAARDLTLPQSAMTGLNLVLDVLRELHDEETIERFSLRKANAQYLPARGSNPDRVQVDLDMTFFGENDLEGSRAFNAFYNAVSEQIWLIDEIDRPTTTPLETGEGIYVNGLRIFLDTTKANPEG